MPNRHDLDRKLPSWVISGLGRAYLAYRAKSYDLTVPTTSLKHETLKHEMLKHGTLKHCFSIFVGGPWRVTADLVRGRVYCYYQGLSDSFSVLNVVEWD